MDFSVVAPSKIERPRYKEIEIPKFRVITTDILNQFARSEDPAEAEDDSREAYEKLHSRCEQLEKVRFINMQINATGGMRGANTDLLSPALLQLTDGSLTPGISSANSSPTTKSPHPSSEKRTIALIDTSEKRGDPRARMPSATRKNNGNNKHVSYLEEEIRRTRASKHTSDYPTAVS